MSSDLSSTIHHSNLAARHVQVPSVLNLSGVHRVHTAEVHRVQVTGGHYVQLPGVHKASLVNHVHQTPAVHHIPASVDVGTVHQLSGALHLDVQDQVTVIQIQH